MQKMSGIEEGKNKDNLGVFQGDPFPNDHEIVPFAERGRVRTWQQVKYQKDPDLTRQALLVDCLTLVPSTMLMQEQVMR
jgi:hypothetical protein